MATLNEIRKFIGITQQQLADKAGISVRQYQRMGLDDSSTFPFPDQLVHDLSLAIGFDVKKLPDINLGIFTKDARASVRSGDLSISDLYEMSLYNQVKEYSRVGSFGQTFYECYRRIPDSATEKLNPRELAELVDAFNVCYHDGRNARDE